MCTYTDRYGPPLPLQSYDHDLELKIYRYVHPFRSLSAPHTQKIHSHIERVLSRWGREGVLGWFSSSSPEEGASFKDAEKGPLEYLAMLLGACGTEEVVAMNALTVNLILMLAAFYRPTQTRFKIIVEEGAFPSDMVTLFILLIVNS